MAAEEEAKPTVGATVVRNYLKVRTRLHPTDETVADSVRSALLRDRFVDRYQITASAHLGMIWLYESVGSFGGKWRAEAVASGVKGVTTVKNRLTVHDYLDLGAGLGNESPAGID